jgi:uncharacterized protein
MTSTPWYREPWPWLLMAGPAAVVVAGGVTLSLAVTSFDGLVADDYYKQGLAVNREIGREARARALGISAAVQFAPDRSAVRVVLRGPAPPALSLALVHPTLPGQDQVVALVPAGPGVYEGRMRAPVGRHVRLKLEDAARQWRLDGDWSPKDASLTLVPR